MLYAASRRIRELPQQSRTRAEMHPSYEVIGSEWRGNREGTDKTVLGQRKKAAAVYRPQPSVR